MNIRAVSVFDQYDLDVLRTWKGRSAILCEAKQGLFVLKEYKGHHDKLLLQDLFLRFLKQEKKFFETEELLPNKEGLLWSADQEGNHYIVKSYIEEKECEIRDLEQCVRAIQVMAEFHSISGRFRETVCPLPKQNFAMLRDFEKHNRELIKVKKYLRQKGQKSEFERFLQQNYEPYLKQALEVTEKLQKAIEKNEININGSENIMCHGDFQYHNILLNGEAPFLINFEKCVWDDYTRDLYHFLRKTMEKWDWSESVGELLLKAYAQKKEITKQDCLLLYHRFAYPEKFWKIVNYYYNTDKSFIPGKNKEKLQILLEQETSKKTFIEKYL